MEDHRSLDKLPPCGPELRGDDMGADSAQPEVAS
jgi:hypothetical protein